jgi:SOS response regulatory protein OraA/RecX
MKPELRISIVKLIPHRMGEEVEVCVQIEAVNGEDVINSECRNITVASEMLFELGNIGFGSLPYELSSDAYDTLDHNGEMWEAVKKGLDLLSYGDNTKSQIEVKLRSRGFGDLSAEAAEYLASRGYIDESAILERYFESLSKKYGPARIRQEILRKGFSREIIDKRFYELIDSVDFDENLRGIIDRKFDLGRFNDRKYRESFVASMFRLGYSPSDTIKILKEKIKE